MNIWYVFKNKNYKITIFENELFRVLKKKRKTELMYYIYHKFNTIQKCVVQIILLKYV